MQRTDYKKAYEDNLVDYRSNASGDIKSYFNGRNLTTGGGETVRYSILFPYVGNETVMAIPTIDYMRQTMLGNEPFQPSLKINAQIFGWGVGKLDFMKIEFLAILTNRNHEERDALSRIVLGVKENLDAKYKILLRVK